MRTLTVELDGKEFDLIGGDKKTCLNMLRERLERTFDKFDEAKINVGYKESRTFTEEEHIFGVDIAENGAGEFRPFMTRQEAVNYFLFCASEKGEHWD